MKYGKFGRSKLDTGDKVGCGIAFFWVTIVILMLIGEVKCIIKAANCNWDPVGKAEIFYTVGSLSGAGSIIGWFDIEDK